MRWGLTSSLQIKRPWGQQLLWSCALLLAFVACAELLFRTQTVQSRLSPPGYNTTHRLFEIKVAGLDSYVETHDSLDCLFVGSSVVHRAIDPEYVAAAYTNTTNKPLSCYNFGLGGLNFPMGVDMTRFLVQRYQPKKIIYGVDAAGLVPNIGRTSAMALRETPWIWHKLGDAPSVHGWLIDQSAAYRAYLPHRDWMYVEYYDTRDHNRQQFRETTAYGYGYATEQAQNLHLEPTIDEKPGAPRIHEYDVADTTPEDMAALQALADLYPDIDLVFVEIPVHLSFIGYFGDKEADYEDVMDVYRNVTTTAGIPFWETTYLQLIPDEGWKDRSHMNAHGAQAFSSWLGTQMGQTTP